MNLFDYVRPASVGEAVAAAAGPDAAYLAAGTNLLDLMKTGAMRPGRLVDITRLPGLDLIERLPDGDLAGAEKVALFWGPVSVTAGGEPLGSAAAA